MKRDVSGGANAFEWIMFCCEQCAASILPALAYIDDDAKCHCHIIPPGFSREKDHLSAFTISRNAENN